MYRPGDESDRAGAVPREPGCHLCPHASHALPCDWCTCDHDIAPGVY